MDALRTPDDRFDQLPDFAFSPHYVEVPAGDGSRLRMHYLDEGPSGGEVVLLLHGEPTWCFLYRKLVRIFREAGLRAVAPDLIGFGRSDKPVRREDYSYQRHVDWLRGFIEALDLRAINLLCQDWGGLIGLRLVAEHSDRFARVIAANTSLPTGDRPPPESFLAWQRASQAMPAFDAGGIVKAMCARPIDPAVQRAYDAPFPDASYQAGARQFPLLVPARPDDPASEANRQAWKALGQFTRPFLTAFSDGDPITSGVDRAFQRKVPGAAGQPHRILTGAGHFLQEDVGEELAQIAIDFVRRPV
jgi:haloalkane dehalogenase